MERQTFELEFLGQKISFRSENDPDTVSEVLELAKMKIQDAKSRCPKAAPHQIALVALFDLTEEVVRNKRKQSQSRQELNEKIDLLVEAIENELK